MANGIVRNFQIMIFLLLIFLEKMTIKFPNYKDKSHIIWRDDDNKGNLCLVSDGGSAIDLNVSQTIYAFKEAILFRAGDTFENHTRCLAADKNGCNGNIGSW